MQPYPLLYLGPVNYYARLVREEQVLFEQWDHYVPTFARLLEVEKLDSVVLLSPYS